MNIEGHKEDCIRDGTNPRSKFSSNEITKAH